MFGGVRSLLLLATRDSRLKGWLNELRSLLPDSAILNLVSSVVHGRRKIYPQMGCGRYPQKVLRAMGC